VRASAVLEDVRRLLPSPSIELSVIGPCQRRVWPPELAAVTVQWIPEPVDVGVVQGDDVTVDLPATAARLERWLADLPATVRRESDRLAGRFDLVVGDVPPPAFEAASHAQIPSVAIANFTWDWIYSELGFAAAARAAAAAYAKADLLLEAAPFAPMPAFPRRESVGLIAREPSSRPEARMAVGAREGESLVLVAFQPASAPDLALPDRRDGRRFLVPAGWPDRGLRDDVVRLAAGARFEDAIAAADVVVGKPGYGLIGDLEAAGARFLYVPRPGFPENAVLEHHLAGRAATASVPASRLAGGSWEEDLGALERAPAPPRSDAGGAVRAARGIARLLGIDTGASPD
jgi:hypothetical protein